MATVAPSTHWGSWVLGDLADTLQRLATAANEAVSTVGRSLDIRELHVAAPTTDDDLPVVTLVAPTELAAARIRHDLLGCEYELMFVEGHSRKGWAAEFLGVRLVVQVSA